MVKTKTINSYLLADISVYSPLLPILAFLAFKHNWKEKLKWVCLLLVLSTLFLDLLADKVSKRPVATGTIVSISRENEKLIGHFNVKEGKFHEGELIRSDGFIGTIKRIYERDNLDNKLIIAEFEGNRHIPEASSSFRVYSNLRIVNIYLLVESVFFFFLFVIAFSNLFWKRVVLVVILLSIIIWLFRNIVQDKIHNYDTFFSGGSTIVIILLSLAFFYSRLNKPDSYFIYSQSVFWIVSAILLYKAGTFFLSLYIESLSQNEQADFYAINSFLNILKNIFFAIAFFINNRAHLKKNKLFK